MGYLDLKSMYGSPKEQKDILSVSLDTFWGSAGALVVRREGKSEWKLFAFFRLV